MSGRRSFSSEIARSSRLGRKYWPPQCRSEICTIVNGRAPLAAIPAKCMDRSRRAKTLKSAPRMPIALSMEQHAAEVGRPGPLVPLAGVGSESPRFQVYRGLEPPRFQNDAELECAKV